MSRHYSRCWGYSRKQINTNPCSQELMSWREKEAMGEKCQDPPAPWFIIQIKAILLPSLPPACLDLIF